MSGKIAMRICFLGDSFVSGAYDLECLGWAGRICAAARKRGHDISPYNLGIRGETSVQLAARWHNEASLRHNALQEVRLVFEFGMNDARDVNGKPQLDEAESLAAARKILGKASEWKPVLMVGPPPVNDEPRNSRVKSISEKLAALSLNLTRALFRFPFGAAKHRHMAARHQGSRWNPSLRAPAMRNGRA